VGDQGKTKSNTTHIATCLELSFFIDIDRLTMHKPVNISKKISIQKGTSFFRHYRSITIQMCPRPP